MAKEIADEDKALFRTMMRDVKPLQNAAKKIKCCKTPAVLPKASASVPSSSKETASFYLSDYYEDENPVLSDSILSYCAADIPGKRFRQLKTAQIKWEVKLDLHGMRAEVAKQALCSFVIQHTASNVRCLLIIHGKGGHKGEAPRLKNLINQWLRQIPQVLAFHSAQPRDGGTGALYVLLKRQISK
ncbi:MULTISPECIES: Smr/MutS family protein [Legionella]|uniref:DNA mismatch repair protein MutS n=1 Tax=Legionella septentrionalis TaxID=2498109 RepID=A0A433JHG3_9GAMM|nr:MULTISPECIES: Smr/MutS family protein [Legionella]MCP0914140.1 Smr/MutS family endonuclease [Legionella sp. 27cVA30]RUQ81792.1 DNA mismatch repair protein MutS [Legionella septentrionalis]RUQ96551.1 DNA mismatch repair protein MutS [Legionella septentrionalis]RUR17375.1 DNA mismatch repair protein MutS [Legionella septentrionalis]